VVFAVIILLLSSVAMSPILDNFEFLQNSSEPFSELWLLDSSHGTENYPFNVSSGETYSVFVGLANRMKSSESYMVHVKFRNVTQYLLEYNTSKPSSSLPLYEFQFSVDNKDVWESPVNFAVSDVTVEEDIITVGDVTINDVVKPVTAYTNSTYAPNEPHFQLFFELWRYNVELGTFQFDNLSVGLWLNMTRS
jgi:uncharacterized membrane protein